jgi:MFS family permease
MAGTAGLYSFLLFLPIILRLGLGYSQTTAYLLAAPPAAAAVIFTFSISVISDKYRVRGPAVILEGVVAIAGMCMCGFLESPAARYAGSFLASSGSNALIVTAGAWQQNNIRGDAKRSVLAAIQVMSAAIGGIYSALVFRQQVSLSRGFHLRG